MSDTIDLNDIISTLRINLNGSAIRGLNNSDFREIKELLNSVTPNDNEHKTEFPDFICDKGFIEHFYITSGNISKKDTIQQVKKTK